MVISMYDYYNIDKSLIDLSDKVEEKIKPIFNKIDKNFTLYYTTNKTSSQYFFLSRLSTCYLNKILIPDRQH